VITFGLNENAGGLLTFGLDAGLQLQPPPPPVPTPRRYTTTYAPAGGGAAIGSMSGGGRAPIYIKDSDYADYLDEDAQPLDDFQALEQRAAQSLKRAARKLHPDLGGDPDVFSDLTAAYAAVKDLARGAKDLTKSVKKRRGLFALSESTEEDAAWANFLRTAVRPGNPAHAMMSPKDIRRAQRVALVAAQMKAMREAEAQAEAAAVASAEAAAETETEAAETEAAVPQPQPGPPVFIPVPVFANYHDYAPQSHQPTQPWPWWGQLAGGIVFLGAAFGVGMLIGRVVHGPKPKKKRDDA
jgi:hypothetical protein